MVLLYLMAQLGVSWHSGGDTTRVEFVRGGLESKKLKEDLHYLSEKVVDKVNGDLVTGQ